MNRTAEVSQILFITIMSSWSCHRVMMMMVVVPQALGVTLVVGVPYCRESTSVLLLTG